MKALFAVVLLTAVPALAQQTQTTVQPHNTASGLGFSKHDSNQPINVSANQFKGDLATKVGTYLGNVIVVQGDMKMRSDTMRIEEAGDKPSKVFAHGNVVINAPNGNGTGDDGVYDLVAKTITLTGKVVLTKEKNVMRGTKLVMDLNTNLADLTAAGMPGGRVNAILSPAQKPDGGQGQKKPAPNGGK
jgi:lipopolysaccharide export system protein LptA